MHTQYTKHAFQRGSEGMPPKKVFLLRLNPEAVSQQ